VAGSLKRTSVSCVRPRFIGTLSTPGDDGTKRSLIWRRQHASGRDHSSPRALLALSPDILSASASVSPPVREDGGESRDSAAA
jgi:hypothetical protein